MSPSLTPFRDAMEKANAKAREDIARMMGTPGNNDMAARLALEVQLPFMLAMATEIDGGAKWADFLDAAILSLSNIIASAINSATPDGDQEAVSANAKVFMQALVDRVAERLDFDNIPADAKFTFDWEPTPETRQ